MPEITTREYPWRLRWEVEQVGDEITAVLIGISDDAQWQQTKREPQWEKKNVSKLFAQVWDYIEWLKADEVAASDAAREAIERERLDLAREDAERLAER